MMVLFIALALFVVEDLKPDIISSNTFFMISIRSSLAPAIFASLFSNWSYFRQIKGIHVLSEGMRMDNPSICRTVQPVLDKCARFGAQP